MTSAEADLRALGWEPDPATLQRFRAKHAADLQRQRDDPLSATDHARFTAKRAQARYRRQREALR